MGKAEKEWNRSESAEASGNDVGVVGLWADHGGTRDELINLEVGVQYTRVQVQTSHITTPCFSKLTICTERPSDLIINIEDQKGGRTEMRHVQFISVTVESTSMGKLPRKFLRTIVEVPVVVLHL